MRTMQVFLLFIAAEKSVMLYMHKFSVLVIAHPAMWLLYMPALWYRYWNDILCCPNLRLILYWHPWFPWQWCIWVTLMISPLMPPLGWHLWFWVKRLNKYWIDYHEIWYTNSRPPLTDNCLFVCCPYDQAGKLTTCQQLIMWWITTAGSYSWNTLSLCKQLLYIVG